MKNFFSKIGNSLKEFGQALAHGDIWVRLSLVIMGAGYFGRKQIMRGILMTMLQVGVLASIVKVFMPYMAKLNTLGTVQREEIFDPLTMQKTVNDYDNSLLILLYGIIGILVIIAFIALYISNIKTTYKIYKLQQQGEHINTFKDDVASFKNERFHITLLTLPSLGVILINVIPILFMVCIAFTN